MLCDLTANNWGDNLVFFPCRWSHYHAKFSPYDEIGRSKSGLPSRPTKLPSIRRTSATVKRVTYKKIEKNNSTPKRVLKTQATHRPKSKFDVRKLNHTFSFKPVANRGAPQGYSTSLAPWKSSIYVQITLLLNVEFVNSLHWWLASHSVSFYNLSVSGITVPTTGTSTYWPSSSTTKLTNPTTKKLTSRRLPNSKGTISVTKGESDEASHIFRDN